MTSLFWQSTFEVALLRKLRTAMKLTASNDRAGSFAQYSSFPSSLGVPLCTVLWNVVISPPSHAGGRTWEWTPKLFLHQRDANDGKAKEEPLNDRIGPGVIIAFVVGIALMLGVSVEIYADASDTIAIAEVVESFRQLAVFDADAAGAVCMSEEAYDGWSALVGGLDEEPVGWALCFLHTLMFAEVSGDGVPYGGLYSPWLGVLLVFELDEIGARVTGFSLQLLDQPGDAKRPAELAESLMEGMRLAASKFARSVGMEIDTSVGGDIRSELADRVAKAGAALAPLYATDSDGDASAQSVIKRVVAGESSGPLSLLGREPDNWIASLVPVWFQDAGGGSSVVVLATSYVPLDLVWVNVDSTASGSVREVALIRLFNSVTTSGGEGS